MSTFSYSIYKKKETSFKHTKKFLLCKPFFPFYDSIKVEFIRIFFPYSLPSQVMFLLPAFLIIRADMKEIL